MNIVELLKETNAGEAIYSKITVIPCSDDEKSVMYLSLPFKGVFCFANDIYCRQIPSENIPYFNGMLINFCIDGGCELSLSTGHGVYIKQGILSIDTSATKSSYYYSSSRYKGLEIILDFDKLNGTKTNILSFFGFNPQDFLSGLEKKSVQGSFLALPSEEWKRKAELFTAHLIAQDIGIEEIRFYVLELLCMLSKERDALTPAHLGFLSSGQRRIAQEVADFVAQHLEAHCTIEDLAAQYNISPSSLKKYFAKLYGIPFSVYVKNVRMQKAAHLIGTENCSIGDVAEKVGYKNQGKFSAAFKEYFGTSPLEYKRLSLSSHQL